MGKIVDWETLMRSYQDWWWREIEDRRLMLESLMEGKTVTLTISDVGIKDMKIGH